MMRRNVVWLLGTIIVLAALAGLYLRNEQAKDIADPVLEQTIQSSMPNTAEPAAAEASIAPDQADNPLTDLVAKYKDLSYRRP